MIYADVIIDISHEKLDRDFQYRVPEELEQSIKPGVVVTVPFGKGNTVRKGYVIGISTEAKYDASRTKEIQGVSTDGETTESRLIALAAWMKETYGSTMIQALKTVLPVKDKVRAKEKKLIFFTGEKAAAEELLKELEGSRFKARERFLRTILESKSLDYTYASKELGASSSVLDFFEKKGFIKIESQEMYRIPESEGLVKDDRELCLNQEQQEAAAEEHTGDSVSEEPVQKTVSDQVEAATEEPEQPEQYEVQQGDTLLEISRRKYGTDQMVKEICAANGLEDSDKIYVGQTIVLP